MSGFTNDIMNAENVNFTGSNPAVGSITSNGQLMIGATTAPYIRPGFITSTDGSVTVTNSAGNIDLAGRAQPFVPNSVLQEFDDFLRGNSSQGKLQWSPITRNWIQTDGTANNPGILLCNPTGGDPSAGFYLSTTAGTTGPFVIGGGQIVSSFVVDLTTLSGGGNTYRLSIGLADSTTLSAASDSFVNGIYFQYTDSVNSGQWQLKSTAASVTTTVSTTTAASTGFHTFSVSSNAAGTSITFYIDGSQVGTAISTNIPAASITPFIEFVSTAGNLPAAKCDLYYVTNTLSNPRPGPTPGTPPADNRLIRQYTPTAVSYQVLGTDSVIGVTNTGAARTITMPLAPTQGEQWTVKDVSLGAATNNITINGNGWNIISDASAATYVINTNGGSAEIFFDGTEFLII